MDTSRLPLNPKSTSWPTSDVSYATAQLVIEFAKVSPHLIAEAVNEAANLVSAADGRVMLTRRAREALGRHL